MRPSPPKLLTLLHRLLGWPLALLILFEEWGWEPLQRALVWLSARLRLRWLEPRIRALPPPAALALFGVPALLLLPVKLLALWALGHGHVLLGAAVVVAAKLVGTAAVARLYTLTRPALMRLHWFAAAHDRWIAWKETLLAPVRASWPWRWSRAAARRLRRRLQARRRG
ncbi:MAG TPA: hypothetical protein VFE82_01145 [Ramlibacter sp.]|jgi:hypothetical protein|uniref:hypothetical protein n=1 Tax=Ramlibacter sp. TaxID=1917967 RepID=UPI002D4BF671|nr:hypothetical protein [Ramlibacter sp.]HZY17051.1 hypothetical protein [Ramlibacter sp.]